MGKDGPSFWVLSFPIFPYLRSTFTSVVIVDSNWNSYVSRENEKLNWSILIGTERKSRFVSQQLVQIFFQKKVQKVAIRFQNVPGRLASRTAPPHSRALRLIISSAGPKGLLSCALRYWSHTEFYCIFGLRSPRRFAHCFYFFVKPPRTSSLRMCPKYPKGGG